MNKEAKRGLPMSVISILRSTRQVARRSVAVLALGGAAVSGVQAGTVGAFDIANAPLQMAPIAPILALQDNVTYFTPAAGRIPANDTQVGFLVGSGAYTAQQVSGNTLNRVTVTFEAWVTDPAQTITFRQPEVYLAGLPSACSWDNLPANRKTITCSYRQTRQGDIVLPAFAVFFNAPAKVVNGTADVDGTDFINTSLRITYAEGSNGSNSQPSNSDLLIPQDKNRVRLGTNNPINIKSAVAKNGANLFTGDAGIPRNENAKRLTQLLRVPALAGPYTVSTIDITAVSGTNMINPTLEESNCMTAGNFQSCPVYETKIVDPVSGLKTEFNDPNNPLVLVYRIDGSNLKRSLSQIVSAVTLTYSFSATDIELPIGACVNGKPNGDGTPCLLVPGQCFRNQQSTQNAFNGAVLGRQADLVGDCEWVTISRGNGFVRIR
jgi:hypothetical protein